MPTSLACLLCTQRSCYVFNTPLGSVWLLQGHALYTRQAGSTIPCPYVDYDKGFNAVFARAYGLQDGETISKLFGSDWGELLCMHRPGKS